MNICLSGLSRRIMCNIHMIVFDRLLCVNVGAGECTGNGETGPSGAAVRPTRTGGDTG